MIEHSVIIDRKLKDEFSDICDDVEVLYREREYFLITPLLSDAVNRKLYARYGKVFGCLAGSIIRGYDE